MKKTICLIMLVFLTLIFVPNKVYAQSEYILPEQDKNILPEQIGVTFPIAPRALEYKEHYFVQENELTYEYMVVYTLPYRFQGSLTINDYILFYRYPVGFFRALERSNNSYILERIIRQPEYTEFHYRVTLRKTLVQEVYPDEDVTKFFESDSAMYIKLDEQDAYQRGFNAGAKSITNKYTSYVFKWTLPFVTLVIISGIYLGFKREWFKE